MRSWSSHWSGAAAHGASRSAGRSPTAARPKRRDCGKLQDSWPRRTRKPGRIQHRVAEAAPADSVREAAAAVTRKTPTGQPSTAEMYWKSSRRPIRCRGSCSTTVRWRNSNPDTDTLPAQINERTGRIHTRTTSCCQTGRLSFRRFLTCRTFRSAVQRPASGRPSWRPGSCVDGGGLLADRAADHGAFVRR